jgi:hypothetical protein
MIFLKGLIGGVVSVILVWIIVVAFSLWRWNATSKHHGPGVLVAHAVRCGNRFRAVISLYTRFGCCVLRARQVPLPFEPR